MNSAIGDNLAAAISDLKRMIDSTYWRQELRAEVLWLKRHRNYRRWSEKQLVLYERRLMLVAFQVRSLLERPKVNDRARSVRLPAIRYKKIGIKPFTFLGAGFPEDRFDIANPCRGSQQGGKSQARAGAIAKPSRAHEPDHARYGISHNVYYVTGKIATQETRASPVLRSLTSLLASVPTQSPQR